MKRSPLQPRKTPLKRSPIKQRVPQQPVKRTLPMKAKRTTTRRGPERNPEYLAWLRDCVCVVCGSQSSIQAAHTINNGRGSKGPDTAALPMCQRHHDEFDGRRALPGAAMMDPRGKAAFAAFYALDMAAEATARFCVWKALNSG